MFIKNLDRDVTSDEYNLLLKPHLLMMDRYIENYIIPEVVSFYLATGYFNSCVYEEPFVIHINTVLAGFFNYDVKNINKVMNNVKRLLLIKYGLKVIGDNPLQLTKFGY